ncbi:MAG: DUF1834 family protein [Nitrospinae bacterium]|nr:DUF1834 family protein [Nitrospinota bacterium]
MNYTTMQIEDAILAALAPLSVSSGGAARTLASYDGQFEDAAAGKDQFTIVFPAALAAFLGSDFDARSAPTFTRTMRFGVFCASSNLGSQLSRRRDAYTLLDASRALLNHNTLGLAISPLLIERESAVLSTRSVTVFCAEYILSARDDAAF